MNKISITGRLAADSESRFTPGGESILSFRVSDDVGYGDKKSTNWWACSLWGKRGEALQQYLGKGAQVVVFGQVQMREWTNKDGVKQLSPDVRVDEIALVGGKPEGQQAPQARQQAPKSNQQSGGVFADDIPFNQMDWRL